MIERARLAANARDYINVLKWMRAAEDMDVDPSAVRAEWRKIEAQRLRQVQEMYAQARIRLQDPHVRGALPACVADVQRAAGVDRHQPR